MCCVSKIGGMRYFKFVFAETYASMREVKLSLTRKPQVNVLHELKQGLIFAYFWARIQNLRLSTYTKTILRTASANFSRPDYSKLTNEGATKSCKKLFSE